jgi:hypothetical protein
MCGPRAKIRVVPVLALFYLASCATQPTVPKTWPLLKAKDAAVETYGCWIRLQAQSEIAGELIAVELSKVWVLTEAGIPTAVEMDAVWKAEIVVYKNNSGSLTVWSVLGTLSSASHGWLAIISGPLWFLAGVSATSSESYDGWLRLPRAETTVILKSDWLEVGKFARFPQGLPKDVDLSQLKIRRTPTIVDR